MNFNAAAAREFANSTGHSVSGEECRLWLHNALDALEAAQKDAGRYRWLRQYNVDSYLAGGSGAKLDADIDAQLEQEAADKASNHPASCGCRACDIKHNQGIFPMRRPF